MDTVSVRDLSVRAVIGVHEWERAIEQTLVFNVDMVADVRTPAASDDLVCTSEKTSRWPRVPSSSSSRARPVNCILHQMVSIRPAA